MVELPFVVGVVAVEQRADRADRHAVAAVGALGIGEAVAEGRDDLRVVAALGHRDRRRADDLFADAHALGADDAAIELIGDQRRVVAHLLRALRAAERVVINVVLVGVVLHLALARLVADGAVERVVDQEEAHHILARLHAAGRVGGDLHPVAQRQGAALGQVGTPPVDLDHAHPAGAPRAQARLVAEVRHIEAVHPRGLDRQRPFRHLDLLAVDRGGDQLVRRFRRHSSPLGQS